MNTKFDQRFICKMALAVGFALFGQAYLSTVQAKEARLGLWPSPAKQPQVRGTSTLNNQSNLDQMGYEGAVVITVIRTGGAYVMVMTVDRGLPFIVELCPDTLASKFIDPELGYSLVLLPHMQRFVELSFAELLAHSLGNASNAELAALDSQRQASTAFWKSLPP